jgi:hypothetical protein
MTYSSGDVYDVTATKAKISIPDILESEAGKEFILVVRNLDATLSVDIWTVGASEVKHRVPPNYDGVLLDNLPYEHIHGGLLGQVTTAGTAQLNIAIYSRNVKSGVVTEVTSGFSSPAFIAGSDAEDEDERDVVSVVV